MYRKHFGLEELPFSVTPDPRFIYNSAIYDEVLGKLRYGIEAKKGFIVAVGRGGYRQNDSSAPLDAEFF